MFFIFQIFFIFLCLKPLNIVVDGILAGEEIDLDRDGYVVKVLAREGPNKPTKSCTGSLISASLVLTSGDCVVDRSTKQKLNEFIVFISKPLNRELLSTAKLLERNEKNAEDFLNERRLLRLFITNLEKASEDDGLHQYRSKTYGEFTACYDDTGAPLLCTLSKFQEPSLLLGIFQSLTIPGGKTVKDYEKNDTGKLNLKIIKVKTTDQLNKCKLATQMRFNLFNEDDLLAKAIEKHALAEFVTVYHECGFN